MVFMERIITKYNFTQGQTHANAYYILPLFLYVPRRYLGYYSFTDYVTRLNFPRSFSGTAGNDIHRTSLYYRLGHP